MVKNKPTTRYRCWKQTHNTISGGRHGCYPHTGMGCFGQYLSSRFYPTERAGLYAFADRLDSLGAIGIARCLLVGGRLNSPLYCGSDPFCEERNPDDSQYTIDHFYAKLFHLPRTMKTDAGRQEAQRRAGLMRQYLDDLRKEIN